MAKNKYLFPNKPYDLEKGRFKPGPIAANDSPPEPDRWVWVVGRTLVPASDHKKTGRLGHLDRVAKEFGLEMCICFSNPDDPPRAIRASRDGSTYVQQWEVYDAVRRLPGASVLQLAEDLYKNPKMGWTPREEKLAIYKTRVHLANLRKDLQIVGRFRQDDSEHVHYIWDHKSLTDPTLHESRPDARLARLGYRKEKSDETP